MISLDYEDQLQAGIYRGKELINYWSCQGCTAAIQRLIQRTKPFVLRRTKQMIASELSPKIETDIQLELSPKQKLLYQRTVEEVKGQCRKPTKTMP